MDVQALISKIQTAAKSARIDAEANMLYRLCDRVAHQGSLFEPPLTRGELAVVKRFIQD